MSCAAKMPRPLSFQALKSPRAASAPNDAKRFDDDARRSPESPPRNDPLPKSPPVATPPRPEGGDPSTDAVGPSPKGTP
jgi:hypothetical protein